MKSGDFTLPSLSKLFPEGIPRPPARGHLGVAARSWTPESQSTALWPTDVSTGPPPTIPIRPSASSEPVTWSTGAQSPSTAVDSMFGATSSSRASSTEYEVMPSPGLSTTSNISGKRKRSNKDSMTRGTQSTKTEKEKRARRTAQRTYQDMEAMLDLVVKWSHGRTQSRGNKAISGLTHTKHDIDYAAIALLAHYLSRDLEKAAFEGTESELHDEWERIITVGGSDGEKTVTNQPLRASLLWYDGIEHLPHSLCNCGQDPSACRKHTMAVNKERRLQKIRNAATRKRLVKLPIRSGGVVNKQRARL